MKNLNKTLIFCFLILLFLDAKAIMPFELKSPDHRISFSMKIEGSAFYSINYQNQSVVEWSKLGISCNGDNWNKQLIINPGAVQLHDTIWTPVYGERNQIRDHYNESVINITRENRKYPVLQLIVRAYNSGIAFRYKFATNENGGPYLHVTNESTEFNFQENTKAWFTARAQSLHHCPTDYLPAWPKPKW